MTQQDINPVETKEKVLLILKLDARAVYERIKYRRDDYLAIFSQRRTRTHFHEIFHRRFREVKVEDLKSCSKDLIVALDQFYREVDEIAWYMLNTEDMPSALATRVDASIHKLDQLYSTLDLYLNAELGHQGTRTVFIP
ncbi:MAG: hypothetical protein WCG27_09220 [Pseudomonadota bacterium]